MNRRKFSMSQDDLSDKSTWIIFKVSKQTYSVQEVAVGGGKLPLVISIEDGQCAQTAWTRISSSEVLFLSHLEQRQRVLALSEDGSYYSFPIDYPLHFILFNRSSLTQTQQTKKQHSAANDDDEPIYYEMDSCRMSLKKIIEQNKFPCRVVVDDTDVSFYSAEDNSSIRFGRLTLTLLYNEKYFAGSEIRNGKLSHEIVLLPTFLRIKVRLVQGFSQKNDRKQSWKSFMTECMSRSTAFNTNIPNPPDDVVQLKATDVTKVIKSPAKLSTIEPSAYIKFTSSSSTHVDHTYEELPLTSPVRTPEAAVSTFKIGKKFGTEGLGSTSDSDSYYDDTVVSTGHVGSFKGGPPAGPPASSAAPTFGSNFSLPSVVQSNPSVQTLNKPRLPKPKSDDIIQAAMTLPKSLLAAREIPRPPPTVPILDASSAKFDGFLTSKRHLTSIAFHEPRTSLDQDSGYSTAPDFPLTNAFTNDHSSGYSSISETLRLQLTSSQKDEPAQAAKRNNSPTTFQTVPRIGHRPKEASETSAPPARPRRDKSYEHRHVPPPPCLSNVEKIGLQRNGGLVKPRSESKSSLKGSTERLFDPAPGASTGETKSSKMQVPEPPPLTKLGQKSSRITDRTVPAAPKLKLTEKESMPELYDTKSGQLKQSHPENGTTNMPFDQRRVQRPQTATAAKPLSKPRKSSPEIKPKLLSKMPSKTFLEENQISCSDSSLAISNFDSVSDESDRSAAVSKSSPSQPTKLTANPDKSTLSADYELTNRDSKDPTPDYELFTPKSAGKPPFSKPKTVPPTPKLPAASPKDAKASINDPIERISDIPEHLNGLSCSQLADCLRLLNMEGYIDVFLENQIDGKLFLELDESILTTDLKVTRLHARKLLVFARQGWRP